MPLRVFARISSLIRSISVKACSMDTTNLLRSRFLRELGEKSNLRLLRRPRPYGPHKRKKMLQTGGPRADIERFRAIPRATPRQSDMMIIVGTLTLKMALRTKVLYDQMPDPKYVIWGRALVSGRK